MTRAVERLTSGVQSLAELLELTAPTLPTATSLSKSGLQIVETQSSFTVRDDGPVFGGIWDDEEERRFYEDILDLKQIIPSSLLGIKETKTDTATAENEAGPDEVEKARLAQLADEEDIRRQLENMDMSKPEDGPAPIDNLELERTASNTTIGSPQPLASSTLIDVETGPKESTAEEDNLQSAPAARLDALFAALPETINREMVDKLAVEVASLNSKATRRRLTKVS